MVYTDGLIERFLSFTSFLTCLILYLTYVESFWHKQIKSLERQIQTVTPRLNSNDPEERANAEAEIERLRREIDTACTRN